MLGSEKQNMATEKCYNHASWPYFRFLTTYDVQHHLKTQLHSKSIPPPTYSDESSYSQKFTLNRWPWFLLYWKKKIEVIWRAFSFLLTSLHRLSLLFSPIIMTSLKHPNYALTPPSIQTFSSFSYPSIPCIIYWIIPIHLKTCPNISHLQIRNFPWPHNSF